MYRSPINRELLQRLTQRDNWQSALKLGAHAGVLLCTAWLFVRLTQTLSATTVLAVPVLLFHGMVYTFLGYAGLGHELKHGTVFTSTRLNKALYRMVSFLTWNNPVYFDHSHSHHHKNTLHTGVDFEVSPAPYPLLERWWAFALFDWAAFQRATTIVWDNACNRVKGPFGERTFPPGSPARQALVQTAQYTLAGHAVLLGLFAATGFWQGLCLLTLAPFFCTLPNRVLAKLQHSGLACNHSDYRANSRTLLLPAFWSWLYWNMNYHIEHHMYPAVPYCKLPALRAAIEHDLPPGPHTVRAHLHTLRTTQAPA
ncbi:MAG TPA: fatty acid desaturase [Limnobacter sp.]|uniref:fatty acid desaturase n=1 Tax=Limnobacter sp. TaxID=2003368 RepID=UPI002ED8750D